MAIFTPGPLAARISGTIGGLNFAHTPSGPVVRRALARPRRLTLAQAPVRVKFQDQVRLWRALSDDDRAAWSTIAAQITYPNRLGVPRALSGFTLYMQQALSASYLDAHSPAIPQSGARTPNLQNLSFSPEEGGPFTLGYSGVNTTDLSFCVVAGARPHATAPRSHQSRWLTFSGFIPSPSPATVNLYSDFSATFGDPVQGEVLAIRAKVWQSDRLWGTWQHTFATVAP